jgi:uncharacterized protein YjcR
MAKRGTPLPFAIRQAIKAATAAGAKIKPTARKMAVSPNTVRKYKAKSQV